MMAAEEDRRAEIMEARGGYPRLYPAGMHSMRKQPWDRFAEGLRKHGCDDEEIARLKAYHDRMMDTGSWPGWSMGEILRLPAGAT